MTTSEQNDNRLNKALAVHQLLIEEYGQQAWHPRLDPLSELIFTILSQNTSDVNRDRAWVRLKGRFPTWESVLAADTAELAEAIRPGGLANVKAPRIQEALRAIKQEQGEFTLDFLAEMEVDEAKRWLTSLHGVGPKTAAIVLLFSLGKPAFPVDTHVHRVSRRLGLIGPKISREKAHEVLEELLPHEIYFTFHLNLITHGREVCKSQQPRCAACVLQEHCDFYRTVRVNGSESLGIQEVEHLIHRVKGAELTLGSGLVCGSFHCLPLGIVKSRV
ncbi:MAG: endonuclease III [Anaerolineales bacterium]|nr:endonuclease III [Anaerolineales bacterium]